MKRILLAFSVLALVLSSCGEYNKVLKSTDVDYKLEKAIEYFDDGRCYQSIPIFEELIGLTRGTQKAEDVYYYHARAHYCVEDYYLANYYLSNFTKTFSYSERAEECQFLAAMCSYNLSPEFSLDQTDTKLAINEMQLFLDKYPGSTLRDSCTTMIDQLNAKLERKNFEVAKLYVKTENFKSAVLVLDYALRDYPNTKYREEMMYMLVKSSYLLAAQSIEEKKMDRFADCVNHYLNFVAYFPESGYLREAENYFDDSQKEIERLKKVSNP
ncbi:MAG: outer membrane protein assembly factor BamD [Flavobacteriales bacterium]|nr:outer membrane protein assembly factor BamD [Flavobacteriales bacterium]